MTENLKFILSRYDHYIEGVQSKSNLYITLNTFVLTGSVTLFGGFENDLSNFLIGLLLLIIISSVIATIYILLAVNPKTKKGDNDSIIFFGNVQEKKANAEYWEVIKNTNKSDFEEDLANQVQQVASIVCKKHKTLKNAGYLLITQFILIGIWLTTFILNKI